VPAGANLISPESPHSPNASDAETLYWIGLVATIILITVINGAMILAVTRFRARRGVAPRRVTGRRRTQFRVTGALSAFMAVLFVLAIIFTGEAHDVSASGPSGLTDPKSGDPTPLKIDATGQQWLWRYSYPNGANSYYRLVVPVDTTVELTLDSTDVVHSWYVPQLGGKFDAVPGHLNHAWFRADQTGDYLGSSAQFSGASYAAMRTEVSVVTPQQYEAYIKQLRSDIQSAQDTVVKEIQKYGGPPGSTSTTSQSKGNQASAAGASPEDVPGPTSPAAKKAKSTPPTPKGKGGK